MGHIVVVGAGVIGQVYAGLLADAGHDVAIVARGARAGQLLTDGVVLESAGERRRPTCRVVADLASVGLVDRVIVAVRGDQLASVQPDIAASDATSVVCMSNPLGRREAFEQEVGPERVVFAFSGIGGFIADDGVVHFHAVRQQPTVVDIAARQGQQVANLFELAGLSVRPETRMPDWLATHAVFIAGIGSILLASGGADGVARSRSRARELVACLREAFDALEKRGTVVSPASLRMIFGRVPMWFAARYWQRQFAGPTVRVSIEPHVLGTRDSEYPQVVEFARGLVGDAPELYRRLLEEGARRRDGI